MARAIIMVMATAPCSLLLLVMVFVVVVVVRVARVVMVDGGYRASVIPGASDIGKGVCADHLGAYFAFSLVAI